MQLRGDALLLSASDLVGHLYCGHLTTLDLAVAAGTLTRPERRDPFLDLLRARGASHESEFVDHLRSEGLGIQVVDGTGTEQGAVDATRAAMRAGVDAIVQAAFEFQGWVGRIDVLRRVERPSALGTWSYEVIDTKLARETRAGTVLQLCLYSALLEEAQGLRPAHSHVVVPWSDYALQTYRMDDYAAYYRRVRRALEDAVKPPIPDIYPEPKEHCEVCRWQNRCDERRRADDHLSFVAGVTKGQIEELKQNGITTLAALADVPLPWPWRPSRGARQSYERVREQARIQLAGRESGRVEYEWLTAPPGKGLASLPAPSPGDIFFDLEGDPFVGTGGIEFLFGYTYFDETGQSVYTADWALTRADEKDAFERFVEFVTQRLVVYPDLHIYHFAPYEPGALKRLMGRFATREEQIDALLRGQRFVDLFGVVRHALRASVESYSIKKLEPLYGYARRTLLTDANKALTTVQWALELGDLGLVDAPTRETVSGYNHDDCESTRGLRDWLEARRSDLIAQGEKIERPSPAAEAPGEALGAWQVQIDALMTRLTHDVPVDPLERSSEQHARWLLAHCLDWHRREQKAIWWEFFRLADLTADDLLDERAGLSGLNFVGLQGGTAQAPIHRYQFPPQECDLRGGEELHQGQSKFGAVEAISLEDGWVDIKKRRDTAQSHPEAVFGHRVISAQVLAESLVRFGEYVADSGIVGLGEYQAGRDLLLRLPPRIGGGPLQGVGEVPGEAARRIGLAMEGGVLPIQGPPGAGKTHTAAQMICDLVHAGRKVGICANSHKVIRHLLDSVREAAQRSGVVVQCVQKPSEMEPNQPGLQFARTSADMFSALATNAQVAGGTAWLWSSPDAVNAIDVLFVDEAAQMSLSNVLAISPAAPSLVMLGDPQQLDQPMQGSHPEGTDVSALHHLLCGEQTIPPDKGLFLAETWRLPPAICSFTSEMFYSDRLGARTGLERQVIRSQSRVHGAGLRYLSVPTEGNQSASPEEAEAIRALVGEILSGSTTWIDREGAERSITLDDILIITPYNAQVYELSQRLPGTRIGTVDKFQGQEAPIAIYSMTTSSPADAPRGMDFLYSPNRFNVATSRARCLSILVASPALFEVSCRTPWQMQLANAFCRYLELAQEL